MRRLALYLPDTTTKSFVLFFCLFLLLLFLFLWFFCNLGVEGAGRGAIANEDLKVGDVALEVPLSVIISSEFLHESDMVIIFLYMKLVLSWQTYISASYWRSYLEGSFLFFKKLMGFLRRQCCSCGAWRKSTTMSPNSDCTLILYLKILTQVCIVSSFQILVWTMKYHPFFFFCWLNAWRHILFNISVNSNLLKHCNMSIKIWTFSEPQDWALELMLSWL